MAHILCKQTTKTLFFLMQTQINYVVQIIAIAIVPYKYFNKLASIQSKLLGRVMYIMYDNRILLHNVEYNLDTFGIIFLVFLYAIISTLLGSMINGLQQTLDKAWVKNFWYISFNVLHFFAPFGTFSINHIYFTSTIKKSKQSQNKFDQIQYAQRAHKNTLKSYNLACKHFTN